MAGSQPSARARGADRSRCPECGSGDLFTIEVGRRGGSSWRGVYCAGEYDRDRRKFLRRSCGYAGASVEVTIAVAEVGDVTLRPAS
ncbi:MAG: hypothetical protein DMF52_13130 [Acidobacteria bacterium]|nr:MAG: hypothetical protein AUI52_05855 [Acidobacteria bacterium 13_1_40CM_2_68_10]OLE66283.1 MAG: hypothetical protein AUG03_00610 [Acidobacteria bacterium 13_1_20CM_2_68_14]PYT34343.1 MAG: hypothetical protein DMF52_13130 [Acidobacteriota bacterium]